ncbi:hypothetical protein JCM19241_4891 [Vibrio ishigakensis]|uniref:LysR substrate-binding domain-containing protein n=2 Tax=Vibrio ishigakensis TaxID=1481914 RepID=A0A0B8QHY7_9VIBR|nr:hypothetical protein JCM19241_4891 [Vibrio ishigakensis]
MIRMVEQGIGWAVLPTIMLQERVGLGTLVEFTPEYMKSNQSYGVDLVWKANDSLGPVAHYLRELLFAS